MFIIPEGLLWAALFGGIIALERSSVAMFLSEPLIICAAAGAFLGDFERGLMFGMLWQMIWMSDLPVGAVKLPDGATGALVSTFLYIGYETEFPLVNNFLFTLCIIFGGISAYLGGKFTGDKRKIHALYLDFADNFADRGSLAGFDFVTFLGIVEQFASGMFLTSLLFLIFSNLTGLILPNIPEYLDGLFKFVPTSIFGISAALLLKMFWNRKTFWAVLAGVGVGLKLFGIF